MRNRMKKAVLMILTLLLLLIPVTVFADTTCIVSGTRNYLALRTEPRTSESNEIGKLYNGETFYVTSSGYNGFAYGYTTRGQYGYVNANYLKVANSQPAPSYQPSQAPGRQPSQAPNYQPSQNPGYQPSQAPGYQPSQAPSYQPSQAPGYQPSQAPSYQPTGASARTVVGTKNYLALRSSPVRSDNNEIGRLHNGDTFYVTEWQNNGFAYGYTASGKYGYVVSAYLR